jgi:hypothetical protein
VPGASPSFQPSIYIAPSAHATDVLSSAISLHAKNIWLITTLVFVIFAPFEIFKALSFRPDDQSRKTFLVAGFLGLVCKALIAPSLIYSLYTLIQTGVAPGLNESYRWGLSRLGKLSLCALMSWALQALGFALLIVPGIILGLAFELVYPLATLENLGPIETLKRSYNLTKGYRWSILGAGLLLGLLCGVVSIPVGIVTAALTVNGARVWPIEAAMALIIDLANEATTVLSLVFYLSILATVPREQTTER